IIERSKKMEATSTLSANADACKPDGAPKSWRDVIRVHDAADLFPMMPEAELKELAADIKAHGLRSRVAYIEGEHGPVLLDGRNRLDALALLGETIHPYNGVIFDKLEGHVDPFAYVISANIHRRHLTGEQKRELIVKLLKAAPEKSNRQIAKTVGASHPHAAK